jgi:hypothetical protein
LNKFTRIRYDKQLPLFESLISEIEEYLSNPEADRTYTFSVGPLHVTVIPKLISFLQDYSILESVSLHVVQKISNPEVGQYPRPDPSLNEYHVEITVNQT